MTGWELALLAVAWVLAGISPGPATLAIAGASMAQGRKHGIVLALGVFTGSAIWALVAGFGLGAVMLANAWAVEALRYVSAFYLMWLGVRAIRAAMQDKSSEVLAVTARSLKRAYLKGLLIHITNPKAIFAWGAVFSVAVAPGSALSELLRVGLTLGFCSLLMFPGYAWVFSTDPARRMYRRFGRWISGVFGMLFCAAGLSILTARLT